MDQAYCNLRRNPQGQLGHEYGSSVHLSASVYHLSLLAKICQEQTSLKETIEFTRLLYQYLFSSFCDDYLISSQKSIPTRMSQFHPEQGVYRGDYIPEDEKFVFANLARAGIIPTQTCFESALSLFSLESLRQDHIYISRKLNQQEEVTGSTMAGSKIGGDIEDANVLFPDPMGATGSSIIEVVKFYQSKIKGTPKRLVALHLMITPEYLKAIKENCPELIVYSMRLDRGLSAPDVLKTSLGSRWSEEKGLNEKSYIVPGAGGVGEVLNNSFV